MRERRQYSRIPVEIDGDIIFSGVEKKIKIDNISEYGLGFCFDDSDGISEGSFSLSINEKIHIQFVDSYNFDNEEYVSIQSLVGTVIQIHEENGVRYVGCKIDIRDCEDGVDYPYYVEHRKSCRFVTIARNMSYL